MKKNNKDNNDYFVLFRGARLTKQEANRAGLSVFFGLFGVVLAVLLTDSVDRYSGLLIITLFAVAGYLLGCRIFKAKKGDG